MMSFKQMFSFPNVYTLAQTKFQISFEDSVALFGCGCITFAILMQIRKITKKMHNESQLRRDLQLLREEKEENEELLRKERDEHEKEMDNTSECYRIIRAKDLRKINELESRCRDLRSSYEDLEDRYSDLLAEYNRIQYALTPHDYTAGLSANQAEMQEQDDDAESEESLLFSEIESIVEENEQPQMRRIWSNKEKYDGTYQHNLPDGFKAFMRSVKCGNTRMDVTFRKADSKENDRWIEQTTGNEYTSLNKARAAFFGQDLTSKQSVWLGFKDAETLRTLREVIEG
jgi:hypothetical protein